ncbi:aminoglycoside phosphotransferase family protein [Actinokineospora iranica]|uniref:phosphotransferase n=1 Tax=Actinokineospora iranica TaxID=1271860 RepID=UPI001E436FF3|nr:phosphotransferase [Actinokineospora iranica]
MEFGTRVWSSPAWRGKAVSWLDRRLAEAGIARTGPVAQPRTRPWSTVLTAPTSAGPVWFKATRPETGFEVALYAVLRDLAPDRVLPPIAADADRGWLLLPDGGPALADNAALIEFLPLYGRLQRDLAPHVGRLLAAGVADMRPAVLPTRFAEAVALVGDVPDRVAAMADTVAKWCARLAASPVPASIDHQDPHRGNVFRDGRFLDWGDSVVAHPFTTMLAVLGRMSRVDQATVLRARDAYLEPFTDLAAHRDLVADLELACRLGKIVRVFTWQRAIAGEPTEFADQPRVNLVAVANPSYLLAAMAASSGAANSGRQISRSGR